MATDDVLILWKKYFPIISEQNLFVAVSWVWPALSARWESKNKLMRKSEEICIIISIPWINYPAYVIWWWWLGETFTPSTCWPLSALSTCLNFVSKQNTSYLFSTFSPNSTYVESALSTCLNMFQHCIVIVKFNLSYHISTIWANSTCLTMSQHLPCLNNVRRLNMSQHWHHCHQSQQSQTQ